MLQSKQSEAFLAVIETGSFEAAAQILHITAAAVSLRIQSLEKHLGHALIIRERPCRATQTGHMLLQHLQHSRLLQQSFLQDLNNQKQSQDFYKIRIASNADSLETWLLPSLKDCLQTEKIVLELCIADQTQTQHLLETGIVNACISTSSKAIAGCQAQFLGHMRYLLVANPNFITQYFKQGLTRQSLLNAPAVIFNQDDMMHRELLFQHYGLQLQQYPHHFIPSSSAFLECIKAGLGYGLVPWIQMRTELDQNQLIELAPQFSVDVPLYWHHWKQQSPPLIQLMHQLLPNAAQALALPST
ncbi:LysR family transcriptional regulator ArgP [Acinetobacter rudis]|uniref:LysR family transcriptional regulator ArgP n=1 Tax=Acinetobacter rudis TaxID=632955 RepID=UPI00280F8408|nr:LysR family transcriptional regulator ArgP [Acinetobacter rudis]MDQ8952059.1 LysR family transcriptional regulator ArgP [Acinetobacter rudis]